MSKAIIEIEKPKRCKDCVWYQADPWFGGACVISKDENGWSKTIGADEEYDVQKWCPLLPKTEAIPIEWLKQKANDLAYGYWDGVKNKLTLPMKDLPLVIETMVQYWRKENEHDR